MRCAVPHDVADRPLIRLPVFARRRWLAPSTRPPVWMLAPQTDPRERIEFLHRWYTGGGVMLMGYAEFRSLAGHAGVLRTNPKPNDRFFLVVVGNKKGETGVVVHRCDAYEVQQHDV